MTVALCVYSMFMNSSFGVALATLRDAFDVIAVLKLLSKLMRNG